MAKEPSASFLRQLSGEVLAAAAQGNADELCVALAQGGSANASDKDRATALGLASLRGHTDCVRLLLSARATVDQPDPDGLTPLMHACDVGYADCVVRRRPAACASDTPLPYLLVSDPALLPRAAPAATRQGGAGSRVASRLNRADRRVRRRPRAVRAAAPWLLGHG